MMTKTMNLVSDPNNSTRERGTGQGHETMKGLETHLQSQALGMYGRVGKEMTGEGARDMTHLKPQDFLLFLNFTKVYLHIWPTPSLHTVKYTIKDSYMPCCVMTLTHKFTQSVL